MGYHSKVYYANLEPPPPGAHFSQEWGLEDALSGSRGDWRQFDEEVVEAAVHKRAGCPDLGPSREFNDKATREFDTHKMAVLSVLEIEIGDSSDAFLTRLKDEVSELTILSKNEVIGYLSPKFPVMTRDYIAAGQRAEVPPHISVLSEVLTI